MTNDDPSQDSGSVRFRHGETLSDAIDRTVAEQFDIALGIGTAAPGERAAAVHATRKAIKRVRSLLRLVRDSIPASYRTDDEVLKLVATELGSIRDSWVMAATLSSLFPAGTVSSADRLHQRLETRYEVESQITLDNEAHMASIIEQLRHVEKRSREWTLVGSEGHNVLSHHFSSIEPGLERVYQRGRKALRNVLASPTDTLLHSWRKRAKYLRHQVEALNVLDPGVLGPTEEGFETLTDLLGDDHDLAVLSRRVATDRSLQDELELDPMFQVIGERRHRLQTQAMELGSDLYAASTADFLAHVASLWPVGPVF